MSPDFDEKKNLIHKIDEEIIPTPRNTKILLVNDEGMILMVQQAMFKNMGYHDIKTAANGLEALNMAKSEGPFKLILMDLNMPVMSGFESTQKMRQDLEYNPYIVALSATDFDDKLIQQCKSSGFNDQFTVPLS